MKDYIISFLDDYFPLIFIFICLITVSFIINDNIVKLYEVQSKIVMHDYGQIFETIEDWKIYKIENYERKLNDI